MSKPAFNIDGFGERVSDLFGILSGRIHQHGNDNTAVSLDTGRLPNNVLCILYRDPLIAKFVDKYPNEAKNNGYEVINNQGEIVEKNNSMILTILEDASIFSRIYGRCYLALQYDNDNDTPAPINGEVKGYEMSYLAERLGDFFTINNERYHNSKVYHVICKKTFNLYDIDIDDEHYQIGVIQQLYENINTYVSSVRVGKYILQNLSYLLLGVKNLSAKTKSEDGLKEVLNRLLSINQNRNVSRSIAYDKENEQLSYISQTVSGYSDMIADIKSLLLAGSDYPYDQIFEDRSGGNNLGSGVNNQLIARMNWGERKKSWSENNWLPILNNIYRIKFGDSVRVEIPYKVSLTRLEQAELEKMASERNKNLIEAGIVSPQELRSGWAGSEFSLNIILNDEIYDSNVNNTTDNEILPDNSAIDNPQADAALTDQEWETLSTVTDKDINRTARGILNGN